MSERRLKQIKNSLIEDLDSIDYYGSETANEGLELYNEVIRLREENERLNQDLSYYQRYGADMLNKNNSLEERIEKAIEYINTRLEEYKNSGLSKKYINHVHYYKLINDLIDILNGRSDE